MKNSSILIAAKKNKVTFILLITVVIGALSTIVNWGSDKHVHYSGRIGFSNDWDVWISCNYIIGMLFVLSNLFETTRIDRMVIICYLFWDFVSFIIYKYSGWPEPKEFLIIGFGWTISLYFLLDRYWYDG